MRIIILGGHGFLGKTLTKNLIKTNNEIYPLSRKDGLDLTDLDITEKIFKNINPDIIINAAANVGSLNYVTQYAADVFDINMRMLLNIYKAAYKFAPNTSIINPVANCAYPGNENLYSEDNFLNGPTHKSVFSYGNTRRMMIVLSKAYSMQFNLHSKNFFVPNMYGPFDSTDPDKAHALNALISRVVKLINEDGNILNVWGSGIAIREWLFAEDCANVFIESILNPNEEKNNWEEINIGQCFGISVKELVKIITEEAGYNGEIIWDKSKQDGAPKKIMDDKKFRTYFPNFKFTKLRAGIKSTIEYYQSIYPY